MKDTRSKVELDKNRRFGLILGRLFFSDDSTVQQLSELTGASESQIRNDLDEIEQRVPLKRWYGGIALATRGQKRQIRNLREKTDIASFAVEFLIHDNDRLCIDSGSTGMAFCQQLIKQQKSRVFALSYASGLSELFREGFKGKYIQIGGVFNREKELFIDETDNPDTHNCFYTNADNYLQYSCGKYKSHKAIMTGTEFSPKEGVYTNSSAIVKLKQLFIKRVPEVIFLIDRSKWVDEVHGECISHCGTEPDQWLDQSKKAKVVFDYDPALDERLQSWTKMRDITEEFKAGKKYPNIRVYEIQLIGQKSQAPAPTK